MINPNSNSNHVPAPPVISVPNAPKWYSMPAPPPSPSPNLAKLQRALYQGLNTNYAIFDEFNIDYPEPDRQESSTDMLEKILKLYRSAMVNEVRGLVPHLVGPPGCGKSTTVQLAADMLDVKLHTINVSRISPLELEGVQMPNQENTALSMLTATFWTQLEEGDILLLDEFLRGFPEVYNGLLDILTSRKVGGYSLPNVFIIAASNSVIAYDRALEDRLLHLPVADPRKSKKAEEDIKTRLVAELGLHPSTLNSQQMTNLVKSEVLPTFNMLDTLDRSGRNKAITLDGSSVRNLIGQAQLRMVISPMLLDLIEYSNKMAMLQGSPEHVILLDGKSIPPGYAKETGRLLDSLPPESVLGRNLQLNIEFIQSEISRSNSAEMTEEEDELFRNIQP